MSEVSLDLHALLLISDSALPLGTFAFSSGLESYLAHQRLKTTSTHISIPDRSLDHFLNLSLSSLASTSLPFLIAAHRDPLHLIDLTYTYDATLSCPVVRRASIAQGKALLGIHERSFASWKAKDSPSRANEVLRNFRLRALLRTTSAEQPSETLPITPHYPPLFGVLCQHFDISSEQTAYIYLFSHLRAMLSAAVRASVIGPYQAQAMLAKRETAKMVQHAVASNYDVSIENAGQVAPLMDLWGGRHELLYSRIFNS